LEHTTTVGRNPTADGGHTDPVSARVEGAAQAAHKATDKIAGNVTAQVERSATAVHGAVESAAGAATSAAGWASTIPEQATQVQARLTESASVSIRAHPLATVAGALIVGYLLGRLARR
jgi:hypothetical protein